MKVARWGKSLAVRIPADVATAMGLKEGDEVELSAKHIDQPQVERDFQREEALKGLRELAKKIKVELPPDWRFDREEIYEERMRELGW